MKAQELQVDGDVVTEAQELKTEVEKEEHLTGKIATALANKEDGEVKNLVEELYGMQRDRSKSQQLTNAVLREARVLVDREGMMQSTKAEMASAIAGGDLTALNAAIEAAIELGWRVRKLNRQKQRRNLLVRTTRSLHSSLLRLRP